jgi:perosamine synthetase
MKPLISLDLANQETFQDSKYALQALLNPQMWVGGSALSAVKQFVAQSVYVTNLQSPIMYTSLYFSGRAALRILLNALHIPSGSIVAIQGFTCAAVALPIVSVGLKPLYIDINQEDFSMDVDDLRRKYIENVKVLILQHSFGIVPSKRDEIMQFCKDYNIFLIEDLAHGYIPNTLQTPPNTLNYCALLSFGRSKLLSSVFGAAVLTPNKALSDTLENAVKGLPDAPKSLVMRCLLYKMLLPSIKYTYPLFIGRLLHRLSIMTKLFPREISSVEVEGQYDTNYEYKYPEVLAYTLQEQICRLPALLKTIQAAVGEYRANLPYILTSLSTPLNRFPYLLSKSSDRPNILRHFNKLGIRLGTWYDQPVGPGKVDLRAVKYILGSCPNVEDVSKRIINLPTNVEKDMARFIAQELKKWYQKG